MGQLRGAVKEAPCRPTQTDERTNERTNGRTPFRLLASFLFRKMVEVTEEQPDEYGWTSKEWFWLILDSSCLSMIIVAATGGDCSGIPIAEANGLCVRNGHAPPRCCQVRIQAKAVGCPATSASHRPRREDVWPGSTRPRDLGHSNHNSKSSRR